MIIAAIGWLLSGMEVAKGQQIRKLTARVLTQEISHGYSAQMKAKLYYSQNGNLVSHITYPREFVMVTDNLGEMKIFDPQKNTVTLIQNPLFSTSSMELYYFLAGLTNDFGLRQDGFQISRVRFSRDLSITKWRHDFESGQSQITGATLVKRKDTLIYMDYRNHQGMIIRKIFFYNYTSVGTIPFPQTITDISYQGEDSSVSRTEYSGFLINDQATGAYFHFQIPFNAKLLQ